MALVARRVSSKVLETREAGRLIYVEIEDVTRFFHARSLLESSAGMMKKVIGERCRNPDAALEVLALDGDIYPEEIGVAPRASSRLPRGRRTNLVRGCARPTSITFDQLQGGELACLEVMARRAQLIELRHRDKVIGNNLGITVDDDTHIYLGTGRTRGLLMVSPALEEFVAKELSRETSAAKERRKLCEERSSKPPAKK